MARPKRCRRVCGEPGCRYFKPRGIPLGELRSVDLALDELEALRLSELERLSQAEAAKMMAVSQPTFNRIIGSAREKTARALVEGLAIRIEAGEDDAPIMQDHAPAGRKHGRCRCGRGPGSETRAEDRDGE